MSLRLPHLLALAVAAALLVPTAPPATAATKKKTQRPAATQVRTPTVDNATALNRVYDDFWKASLRLNPLQATLQGEHQYNDQLPNYLSPAARRQSQEFMAEWLGKVEAIGNAGLTGQDRLNYDMFVRDARGALATEQFPSWMLPVNPYSNPASLIALLGSGMGAQPFNTLKDYENWSRRAIGVPALFEQAIANMREGMAAGVVQPRAAMEKVLPQLDAVIQAKSEDSLFWAPIRNMPDSFAEADRQRLTDEYRRMIDNRLMPAYRALRGFIATVYLPATRSSDGLSALPGGEQWYQQILQHSTGDTRSADQIHQLSLDELASAETALRAALKQARIRGKPEKVLRSMRSDAQFQFKDEAALLAHYKALDQQLASKLPALFAPLPKATLEIRVLEPERAATASAAAYQAATAADQPGVLYLNSQQLTSRYRWAAPMQYLHEALPGHHLQLSLQQQIPALPHFRRQAGDLAFVEGWGLYAESLGTELGMYADPYDHVGYLYAQVLRNARMVVDTGLHADNWSRAQAVDFLVKRAYLSPQEAAADVERSIAQPGQALTARLGELRIRQLRQHAQSALGAQFNLPAFHNELLKDGSLPLDILHDKMERWITTQTPPSS